MRFKKILAVVMAVLMLAIALVGCDALSIDNNNNNDNDNVGNGNGNGDSTIVDDGQNDDDNIETAKAKAVATVETAAGEAMEKISNAVAELQQYYERNVTEVKEYTIATIQSATTIDAVEEARDWAIETINKIVKDIGPKATLSDLCPWINNLDVEDIVEVRRESGYYSVAPGAFIDISYSTNSVDIANSYALLSCKLKALSHNWGIDGGRTVEYCFTTRDNNVYRIAVYADTVQINGYDYMVDNFDYEFKHPNLQCYSILHSGSYEICSLTTDSAHDGETIYLGDFEFCEYNGEIPSEPRYLLTCYGIRLLVLSENLFVIKDGFYDDNVVYQITSGNDFSKLFADN